MVAQPFFKNSKSLNSRIIQLYKSIPKPYIASLCSYINPLDYRKIYIGFNPLSLLERLKKALSPIKKYRGIKAMPIFIGHSPNSAPFANLWRNIYE